MIEELSQLFLAVGRPSLATLKKNAEIEGHKLSRSAFWYLLNGRARPRLTTVEAFVMACSRIARQHRPPIELPAELTDLDRWRQLHVAGDPADERDDAVVPHQLPSVAALVGRRAQLDQLDGYLGASHIVVVTGMAGVGKTTLAVSWARRVADRFPDGQLYANLQGFSGSSPMVAEQVLRGFFDALDVPPAKVPSGLAAREGLYRSLLDGRRLLVLLDNARDAEQVRSLLPGAPGCLAVVTSRRDLAGLVAIEGARPMSLDVLSEDEARQLLGDRLGPGRVAAEPAAVDRLIAGCAGLPLALAVVAGQAARQPVRPLTAIAADLRPALDALATGDDVRADVRAVLSWSYQALPAPAARLFRLLAVHPGPEFDADAAAGVAGVAAAESVATLGELAAAHLLTARGPGRYDLHDLVREYADELLRGDGEEERRRAVERLVRRFLERAEATDQLLGSRRDDRVRLVERAGPDVAPVVEADRAWDWLRAERPTLVSTVDLALRGGRPAYAWQLSRALSTFLDRDLHWTDWLATATAALRAGEALGHPAAQAIAHRSLAHLPGRPLARPLPAPSPDPPYLPLVDALTTLCSHSGYNFVYVPTKPAS